MSVHVGVSVREAAGRDVRRFVSAAAGGWQRE